MAAAFDTTGCFLPKVVELPASSQEVSSSFYSNSAQHVLRLDEVQQRIANELLGESLHPRGQSVCIKSRVRHLQEKQKDK
jgi:hypothetical protein